MARRSSFVPFSLSRKIVFSPALPLRSSRILSSSTMIVTGAAPPP